MMNGTVSSIVPEANNTYFTVTNADEKQYLSKKVILATGMKDLLSNTPGLSAGCGKGIYCTHYLITKQQSTPQPAEKANSVPMVRWLGTPRRTLCEPRPLHRRLRPKQHGANKRSTQTSCCSQPAPTTISSPKHKPRSINLPKWAEKLALYNIGVEDRTIAAFSRVNGNDSDYAKIAFTDGDSIVWKRTFPAASASELAMMMLGLKSSVESDQNGGSFIGFDSPLRGEGFSNDKASLRTRTRTHVSWG